MECLLLLSGGDGGHMYTQTQNRRRHHEVSQVWGGQACPLRQWCSERGRGPPFQDTEPWTTTTEVPVPYHCFLAEPREEDIFSCLNPMPQPKHSYLWTRNFKFKIHLFAGKIKCDFLFAGRKKWSSYSLNTFWKLNHFCQGKMMSQ